MILRDDLHVVDVVAVQEDAVAVLSDGDDHPHHREVVTFVVVAADYFDIVPSRCTTTTCWKRQK